MTSEVPPRQSSSLNRSWSSGERRESFFWTLSSTLMVARFVSRTTSNYKWRVTEILEDSHQLQQKSPLLQEEGHKKLRKNYYYYYKSPGPTRTLNGITVMMYVLQIFHPRSDEAVPHKEFSSSWRRWSPLTKRGMTPRCHSTPTHIQTKIINHHLENAFYWNIS